MSTPQREPGKQLHDEDDGRQKLGRVTSLIGFMFPLQTLLIGLTMGPLMSALDSPWPPMFYVDCAGCLAAMVMAGVYIVKQEDS